MTHVLILGANGQLARNTTRWFLQKTDARLVRALRACEPRRTIPFVSPASAGPFREPAFTAEPSA